jgi:uncharacterized protein YqeY
MRQVILDDIITAMKAKDKDTLSVLRMVKGAMQLEEINVKHELNDEEMTRIISKQIKIIHNIDLKPQSIYDSWAINNFVKEYKRKKFT